MRKVEIIVRHSCAKAVKEALLALGIHGMSKSEIQGFGHQGGHKESYRGTEFTVEFVPKVKLEVVVAAEQVEAVIDAVCGAAATGKVGDGKIFVLPVEDVVRIRTRERGKDAV